MKKKHYFYITSIIFLIVGVIHLVKIITGFEIRIFEYLYPLWLSVLEMIIAFYFVILGFYLGNKE